MKLMNKTLHFFCISHTIQESSNWIDKKLSGILNYNSQKTLNTCS